MIEKVKEVFNRLSIHSLELIDTIYAGEVVFIDPFQKIQGRDALKAYFKKTYSGVEYSNFQFKEEFPKETEAVLLWNMQFRHKWLKRGELIEVEGSSHLKWTTEGLIYHRDYVDSSNLVFENVPGLGRVFRGLKSFI